MQEWKAQANLEEEYDLKPSVMSSTDPIKEAESQIFFINHFLKPMLQLTVKAVPEMSCYLNHLKSNLRTWVKRKDELSKQQQQVPRKVVDLPPTKQVPLQRRRRQTESDKGTAVLLNGNGSAVCPGRVLAASCAITDHHSLHSSQSPPPPPFVPFSSQNGVATPPLPPPPSPPRTQADSFMTAFPLTLPTFPPKKFLSNTGSVNSWIRPTSSSSSSSACSSSSSRSVSEHETGLLNSPSGESASDFHASHMQHQVLFSPISEASSLSVNGGGGKNSQTITSNYRPVVGHRCRSNSSVSNSSVCECGASVNPSSLSSPGPPTDSNHVFRIWCSPTQFSTTGATSIADETADDDDDDDDDGDDDDEGDGDDEKHASTHAVIRNASLLGSLRQRRQKDVSGVVSLKDFIAGVDRRGGKANGLMLPTTTNTTTTRRAVRYSWCAGMAESNGDGVFRQYQNDGGSSTASSPEIPSAATAAASYATSITDSGVDDEDETVTLCSTRTSLSQRLSGSLSICPLSSSTTTKMKTVDTAAPIKFQALRVRPT